VSNLASGMDRLAAAPVQFVEHDGYTIALRADRPAWAVLNDTAAWLVRQSAGGTSMDALLAGYRERFGDISPGVLAQTLSALADCGLMLGPGEAHQQITRDAGGPPPPYQVEHLYVELHARCNLRCVHCYMHGDPHRPERLELDEVHDVLEQFAGLGGRYVTLSGGEPLIYPHFPEVARMAADLGLAGTVITNGVPLRGRHLDLIGDLGFTLAISLDGATPETNDPIRGRNTFPRIITALQLAVSRLGGDRVILSFSPSRANMEDIPAIFGLAEELGIRRLNLSLIEMVGRAADNTGMLGLLEQERSRIVETVYEQAVQLIGKIEVDFNDTRNILELFATARPGPGRAHPLWRGVRLDSSGNVYPSTFGSVPDFRLGNIREQSLADIFTSGTLPALYLQLQDRVAKVPQCRVCPWRQICGGGSVSAAYYSSGDLYQVDPYCAGYLKTFPAVAVALTRIGQSG
jgi:Fe-coproporphyrin III synthase